MRIYGAMALAWLIPSAGMAAETLTYSYDAKGRLVKVEHAGSVNAGLKAEYVFDRAHNRKNVKVTGSANPPPSP